jgi:hypothetical protein
VDFHSVQDFADELSEGGRRCIRVYETSSKSGENVDKVFVDIPARNADALNSV